MAIRIITDSTCDIGLDEAHRLGVDIVPLSVLFDGVAYKDGVDISRAQFYEMLGTASSLPTTTQPPPSEFEALFRKYTDAGDEVIGIFISGKISGTFQSAGIAKQLVGSDSIYLVDSTSATMGLGLLVYEAVRQASAGVPASRIAQNITDMAGKLRFYAIVDTLKYLKMGGRVSPAVAFIGGVLSIKPLVGMIDGKVELIGKAKGQKAAYQWIINQLKEHPHNSDCYFALAHSHAPHLMNELISMITEGESPLVSKNSIITAELGSIIGTHGGPGCTGFAYIAK